MDNTHSAPKAAWQDPLLDIIEAIVARKWCFIAIVAIGSTLGLIRLLTMDPVYKASAVAVLLPREKAILDATIDTSSIETSDDRANRGDSGNLMLPPNPTLYTTIIHSRSVASELAIRFSNELRGSISENDRSEEVVDQLHRMITTTSTEEGLITVEVRSHEPELSASIANALFEQCEIASKEIERRLLLKQAGHLDKALINAKLRLEDTERQLSEFTSEVGLVNTDLQVSNQLRTVRELKVESDRLKADLAELRLSHTEKSHEVIALRTQIAAIEKQIKNSNRNIVGSVGTETFGRLNVEYKTLEQRVRFERDMVSALATKADIFRLRAEQPIGNLAIIRPANTPLRPAGPSKKKELGLAIGLSSIIAFGFCILAQQWQLIRKHPTTSTRLDQILYELQPGQWLHRRPQE